MTSSLAEGDSGASWYGVLIELGTVIRIGFRVEVGNSDVFGRRLDEFSELSMKQLKEFARMRIGLGRSYSEIASSVGVACQRQPNLTSLVPL